MPKMPSIRMLSNFDQNIDSEYSRRFAENVTKEAVNYLSGREKLKELENFLPEGFRKNIIDEVDKQKAVITNEIKSIDKAIEKLKIDIPKEREKAIAKTEVINQPDIVRENWAGEKRIIKSRPIVKNTDKAIEAKKPIRAKINRIDNLKNRKRLLMMKISDLEKLRKAALRGNAAAIFEMANRFKWAVPLVGQIVRIPGFVFNADNVPTDFAGNPSPDGGSISYTLRERNEPDVKPKK